MKSISSTITHKEDEYIHPQLLKKLSITWLRNFIKIL